MYGPCIECDGLWALFLIVAVVVALSPVFSYNRKDD